MITIQRICKTCATHRPFEKEKVNHVLHFLLSIFTIGFWAIPWMLMALSNALSSYRCRVCGGTGWRRR